MMSDVRTESAARSASLEQERESEKLESSDGLTLERNSLTQDANYVILRVTRIAFFLIAALLIYFIVPFSELYSYLLSSREDSPFFDRRQLLFSMTQKAAFFGIAFFLLMQLRKLLEDLLTRQLVQEMKIGSLYKEMPADRVSTPQTVDLNVSPGEPVEELNRTDEEFVSSPPLDATRIFRNSRSRMRNEIRRLNSISTRNLAIGIGFSVAALFFIASPLIFATSLPDTQSQGDQQNAQAINWLLRYYLPRLGVGLLLQFVGFFFLRLYVANEQDIKHNSNEITNMEAKMIAVQVALDRNDRTLFRPIVDSFAKTERNFILKKNEKSVHDEDRKFNDIHDLITTIGAMVRRGPAGGQPRGAANRARKGGRES